MEKKEMVFAVPKEDLFGYEILNEPHGFLSTKQYDSSIFKKINMFGVYKPRYGESGIEYTPNWKQIIPYTLFEDDGKFFVYRRLTGDERLQGELSIGIGGHIRKNGGNKPDILMALLRKFHEEVDYSEFINPKFLGILNIKENKHKKGKNVEVSSVHTGLVFIVKGNGNQINIHESLKQENEKVGMFSIKEMKSLIGNFEPWSQTLIRYGLNSFLH